MKAKLKKPLTATRKFLKNPGLGEVRAISAADGSYYFVGADVAKALGYADPESAVMQHVGEEYRLLIDPESEQHEMLRLLSRAVRSLWLINEAGLYFLILKSKSPAAKVLQGWGIEDSLMFLHESFSREHHQLMKKKNEKR
jgi:prophage antirepressor-like protein